MAPVGPGCHCLSVYFFVGGSRATRGWKAISQTARSIGSGRFCFFKKNAFGKRINGRDGNTRGYPRGSPVGFSRKRLQSNEFQTFLNLTKIFCPLSWGGGDILSDLIRCRTGQPLERWNGPGERGKPERIINQQSRGLLNQSRDGYWDLSGQTAYDVRRHVPAGRHGSLVGKPEGIDLQFFGFSVDGGSFRSFISRSQDSRRQNVWNISSINI